MNVQLMANTIRGLAMDGVEKAKSGHPGMPMGTADFAATLWFKFMKHNPANPNWPDRDRFVLSAGHGSMLLYSLLHLAGYDMPLEELQRFRQVDSKTPGHPEHGWTAGVETTTGPLGQGIGNAVGMAIAEAMLAARFNRENFKVVDHYTYAICGDGCLMEGISHEALALAGHLKLNKLVLFYDSNGITIEGKTSLAYSDDVRRRFEAYHWNVLEIDGHNLAQIEQALTAVRAEKERPTVIIGHTHIGHGAPTLHDSHEAHGAPLGAVEVKAAKTALGLPPDQDFYVPEEIRAFRAEYVEKARRVERDWKLLIKDYQAAYPAEAAAFAAALAGELPADLEAKLPVFDPAKPVATRSASGQVLNAIAPAVPNLVGGSADLAPSNNTYLKGLGDIAPGQFGGRNFHFGVREHGMGSVMNGISLHGGFRIYGATFMVFADYFRPAIRLAALMEQPVIYVLTHDSFYVGEDGPTHQPVEQLVSLRTMMGLTVIRPADATETAAAWVAALRNTRGPTALLLTRQNLPVLDRGVYPPANLIERGAYTLWQSGAADAKPDLILIGSGSETPLALEAGKKLAAEQGIVVRVVSFPSWELFEKQTKKYRNSVLPPACRNRLVVEAGRGTGWERYVGSRGRMITLDRFGASGPFKALQEKFGFTVERVYAEALALLGRKSGRKEA